jgi:hypothetical protein
MKVRVQFRYNSRTGEVDIRIDDIEGGARARDHDARHDRITADVARVVDRNPLLEQLPPDAVEPPREPMVGIPGETRETRTTQTEEPRRHG